MKKTKFTLNNLNVKSFTTSKADLVRGGESNDRICASYFNCDSKMICETINYTACDGGACKRY